MTQLKETDHDPRSEHFSNVLTRFESSLKDDRVSLGALIDFLGSRSIGAMLLFLALPMALPIPAPGLSAVFGVPLILISAQLVIGRRRAWLPARLARRSIARDDFQRLVRKTLPTLRVLERFVRPRITWLASDWTRIPIGVICLVLAVIITLPVPFGNVVPGLAITLMALGLLERDGLAVGSGLLIAAAAAAVITIGSTTVAHLIQSLLH